MGLVHVTGRVSKLALGASAVTLILSISVGACREPTQVTLAIGTDLPCAEVRDVAITVGTRDDVAARRPVAVASACSDQAGALGTMGTFVVLPSSAKDGPLAVRVVSGVNRPAEECEALLAKGSSLEGCIVARRELAFVPHSALVIPVVMRRSCIGVACGAHETCIAGRCASAAIEDPGSCPASGCDEDRLVDLVDTADGGARDASANDAVANDAANNSDAADSQRTGPGSCGVCPDAQCCPDGTCVGRGEVCQS